MPRFIRLIRQLRKDHTNAALRHEVYALADELYTRTLYDWIDELFSLGLVWYTSSNPDSDSMHQAKRAATEVPIREQTSAQTPYLQFATVRLYCRFVCYHEIRCALCGCIQTLCSIPPPPKATLPTLDFDLTAAQSEDIHAANMIASCDVYALSDPSPMKMRRTRLVWPALFAYGTWRRLEFRAEAALATALDPIASQTIYGDTMLHNNGSASQNSATDEIRAGIAVHDGEEGGAGSNLVRARTMKAWAAGVLKWSEDKWSGRVWREPDMNWVVSVAAGEELVAKATVPQEKGEEEGRNIDPKIYEIIDGVNATTNAEVGDDLGGFETTWKS